MKKITAKIKEDNETIMEVLANHLFSNFEDDYDVKKIKIDANNETINFDYRLNFEGDFQNVTFDFDSVRKAISQTCKEYGDFSEKLEVNNVVFGEYETAFDLTDDINIERQTFEYYWSNARELFCYSNIGSLYLKNSLFDFPENMKHEDVLKEIINEGKVIKSGNRELDCDFFVTKNQIKYKNIIIKIESAEYIKDQCICDSEWRLNTAKLIIQ